MRRGAQPVRLQARAALLCGLGLFGALPWSGCSPTYVIRAGYEEAKVLWRRQPIEQLLRDPATDAATRAKLQLVLAARIFARDRLGLRVDHSYATFARVDRDQMVHVVTAAYQLRLAPYTWWFPIVGRVPYKGFFSATAAHDEAARLDRQGYDTYVRPAVAFSTLGWFADPLVSPLLRYDAATLANVIIHELLHNTTYVPGHAEFDESFANFVGHRGAMAFFAERGDAGPLQDATAAWNDALVFSAFMDRFAIKLRAAYTTGITLDGRRRLLEEGVDEFRQLSLRTDMYRDFAAEPLNNAIILQYLMYNDRLRLFEEMLRQANGDVARSISQVRSAVEHTSGDPFAALEAIARPVQQSAVHNEKGEANASPPPSNARASRPHQWPDSIRCATLKNSSVSPVFAP